MKEHKKNHTKFALNFLTQYEEVWNDLLEQIITGNEKWIHFCKPEKN